ncbi:MAG: hypothetical protein Q8N29_09085 [Methylobacter sp.]|nr:hypothetical protein [Methylobacter sp.]MDP2429861.1 hypothetical protein [Methylobacter sp.]MDP3054779.1 hypothetical protein [Methylobacter sp.]
MNTQEEILLDDLITPETLIKENPDKFTKAQLTWLGLFRKPRYQKMSKISTYSNPTKNRDDNSSVFWPSRATIY